MLLDAVCLAARATQAVALGDDHLYELAALLVKFAQLFFGLGQSLGSVALMIAVLPASTSGSPAMSGAPE